MAEHRCGEKNDSNREEVASQWYGRTPRRSSLTVAYTDERWHLHLIFFFFFGYTFTYNPLNYTLDVWKKKKIKENNP
jgi:hypothetical protein